MAGALADHGKCFAELCLYRGLTILANVDKVIGIGDGDVRWLLKDQVGVTKDDVDS